MNNPPDGGVQRLHREFGAVTPLRWNFLMERKKVLRRDLKRFIRAAARYKIAKMLTKSHQRYTRRAFVSNVFNAFRRAFHAEHGASAVGARDLFADRAI
jgi:hypothetical protein